MGIVFALVHHANQYLVTEGYENRDGLREALGSIESKSGFAWILELDRRCNIPANVHFSGTLLEPIAWHAPEFLFLVREYHRAGIIDLVGSCYGQNAMRFFDYEHTFKQLNEELLLYQIHLKVDPGLIRAFWPPERVCDTQRMAPGLTDSRLLNRGYVLLDDRLLLPTSGCPSPRKGYDRNPRRDVELHKPCPIENGDGLIALPIATQLRLNIPPADENQFRALRDHCNWMAAVHDNDARAPIAIYADDIVLAIFIFRAALSQILRFALPYLTFYLSVILPAWYCGLGPALFVTFLRASTAEYVFAGPSGSFRFRNTADAVRLALFVGVAVLLSVLLNRVRIDGNMLPWMRGVEFHRSLHYYD